MVTSPSASAVANPPVVIVAMDVLELAQTTVDVMSFPKLSIALNCNCDPGTMIGSKGVTVIEVAAPPLGDWFPVD